MKDHRLVHAALFLLLVAVSLVYAVFFDTHASTIRQDVVILLNHRGYAVSTGDSTIDATGSTVASTGTNTGSNDMGNIVTGEDTFLNEVLGTTSGKVLSGTELYYGSLDILKTLGIRYEYILKDTTYDIYYVYIGKDKTYNITDITSAIGGKTVEIYARNDIINNLYFGDRVTFVTLPQQLPSVTNVFIRTGNDLRMIQDVSGEYKQHKRHIRYVFTNQ